MRPIESRDYIVETNPNGVYIGRQITTGYEYASLDEAQVEAERSSRIETAEGAGLIAAGLTLSALGIYMMFPDGREGIQRYLSEPVHYLGAAVAFIGSYAYLHGIDVYERAAALRGIAVRAKEEIVRRIEGRPREVVEEVVPPPPPPAEIVEESHPVEPVSEVQVSEPPPPPGEVEASPAEEHVVEEVEIPETPPPPQEAASSEEASEKIPQAPLEGVLGGASADIDAAGPQEDIGEETSPSSEEDEVKNETPEEREQRLNSWEASLMEKQEKLEQKSAELEVWEVKLRDWEEKLKSWEERLQNHENRLKELEKRLGINKEEVVANPVDSQDSSQATPQTPTETEEPKGDGKEKIKRAGRRTKKAIQDLAEKIQSTPKGSPTKDSQEPTIRKIRRIPVDWIEFREIMEKPQGELFPDLPEELGHNCAGNDCEECKKRRIMVA